MFIRGAHVCYDLLVVFSHCLHPGGTDGQERPSRGKKRALTAEDVIGDLSKRGKPFDPGEGIDLKMLVKKTRCQKVGVLAAAAVLLQQGTEGQLVDASKKKLKFSTAMPDMSRSSIFILKKEASIITFTSQEVLYTLGYKPQILNITMLTPYAASALTSNTLPSPIAATMLILLLACSCSLS